MLFSCQKEDSCLTESWEIESCSGFFLREEEEEVALFEQVHKSCPGNRRLGWTFPCLICRKNRGVRAEGERLTQKERERVCGKRSEKELGLRWEIRV